MYTMLPTWRDGFCLDDTVIKALLKRSFQNVWGPWVVAATYRASAPGRSCNPRIQGPFHFDAII